MPRASNGVYTLPNTVNPVVPGTTITSIWANSTMTDIGAALTDSLDRYGRGSMAAHLKVGGFRVVDMADGTLATDAASLGQLTALEAALESYVDLAIDDLRDYLTEGPEVSVASAATTTIGGLDSARVLITGTTGITSFGTVYQGPIFLRFADVLTLTHSATLVLPTSANITTAANDYAVLVPNSATPTGWRVAVYQRASGESLVVPTLANIAGTLDISKGGTGATNAADAFNALKQDASDTYAGVAERGTNGEAQGGTDNIRFMTAANLTASQFGRGQTWQNLTASRSAGVTYQNLTGRPIQVSVRYMQSGNGTSTLLVDSVEVAFGQQASTSGGQTLTATVQNGSFYQLSNVSNTLTYWAEMR